MSNKTAGVVVGLASIVSSFFGGGSSLQEQHEDHKQVQQADREAKANDAAKHEAAPKTTQS